MYYFAISVNLKESSAFCMGNLDTYSSRKCCFCCKEYSFNVRKCLDHYKIDENRSKISAEQLSPLFIFSRCSHTNEPCNIFLLKRGVGAKTPLKKRGARGAKPRWLSIAQLEDRLV